MKQKWWGGFVNGRLDSIQADAGWGGFGHGDLSGMPAVFKSRADARRKYQDVREVDIGIVAKSSQPNPNRSNP